jgi:hypothetical protein
MWEHVLHQLHKYRLHGRTGRAWSEYAYAYGMAGLREKVLLHAPTLETEYQQAVANGYAKDFDRDYVPKYMEDHVARVLT